MPRTLFAAKSAPLLGALYLATVPLANRTWAQDRAAPGTVSGTVLDSAGLKPLAHALVSLEPLPGGLMSASAGSPSGFAVTTRSRRTGPDGRYRFHSVAPGSYRLSVRRIGFEPAQLEISLGTAGQLSVSVGLNVVPIVLSPVAATDRAFLFGRSDPVDDPLHSGRAAAIQARREDHVNTDVRTLTHDDVVEAITLGESDIFRALQRIPGVNTRDDWTAELWIRGAGWDQTQVYFDGMPLFNPLHGGGVTSAVHADAVGTLFLYPGVRPTRIGGGSSGVVDIRSRPANPEGHVKGFAALSLLNASMSLESRIHSTGTGGVVTARRTAWNNIPNNGQDATRGLPAAADDGLFDVSVRADQRLGNASLITVSGLMEEDRITPQDDLFVNNRAQWGNRVARLTLSTVAGLLQISTTVGVSRFRGSIDQIEDRSINQVFAPEPTQLPTENSMRATTLMGEVSVPRSTGGWSLSSGYEFLLLRSAYDGAALTPFSVQSFLDSLSVSGQASVATVWSAVQHRRGPVALDLGMRLETGSPIGGSGDLRVAPRLSGGYSLGPRVTLSVSLGRSFQYFRAIGPSGLRFGPSLIVGHVWAVSGDTVPAVETEIATAGAEVLLGDEWIGSLSTYVRRVDGLLIPDPTPGIVPLQSLGIAADNSAWGVEVNMRKIVGKVTGSFGYSYGKSNMIAAGITFPAPGDYRHSIDISLSTVLDDQIAGGGVRVGAAYSANSGSPYTRVTAGQPVCDFLLDSCKRLTPFTQAAPNAETGSWYGSLDLLFEWYRQFGAVDASAFVQIRNALDQSNSATYRVDCSRLTPNQSRCAPNEDSFEPGIPIYPAFGFRISF